MLRGTTMSNTTMYQVTGHDLDGTYSGGTILAYAKAQDSRAIQFSDIDEALGNPYAQAVLRDRGITVTPVNNEVPEFQLPSESAEDTPEPRYIVTGLGHLDGTYDGDTILTYAVSQDSRVEQFDTVAEALDNYYVQEELSHRGITVTPVNQSVPEPQATNEDDSEYVIEDEMDDDYDTDEAIGDDESSDEEEVTIMVGDILSVARRHLASICVETIEDWEEPTQRDVGSARLAAAALGVDERMPEADIPVFLRTLRAMA